MEKSNDLIGNRTRDLPACSIIPQQTTLPLVPTGVSIDTISADITVINEPVIVVGMRIGRENRITRRKTVPMSLSASQIAQVDSCRLPTAVARVR
jgi:hypothetical protein